jgi:hypothetical protein
MGGLGVSKLHLQEGSRGPEVFWFPRSLTPGLLGLCSCLQEATQGELSGESWVHKENEGSANTCFLTLQSWKGRGRMTGPEQVRVAPTGVGGPSSLPALPYSLHPALPSSQVPRTDDPTMQFTMP